MQIRRTTSMMIVASSLLLPGCMLRGKNQEGIEIVRHQAEKAQDANVKALTGVKSLVDELNEAAEQEREPDLKTPLLVVVGALEDSSNAVDEIGKTAVTLQQGIGKPERTPPVTAAELEAWRRTYAVLARLYNFAETWIKSQLPMISSPGKPAGPEPWSTGETVSLITIITTALTGGGVLGQRQLKKRGEAKREKAEADDLVRELRLKMSDDEFNGLVGNKKTLRAKIEREELEQRINGNA